MELSTFTNFEFLGKGSFGKVYKVYHRCYKQNFALKQIAFEHEQDFEEKNREVSIMRKLNHHNIVKFESAWVSECKCILGRIKKIFWQNSYIFRYYLCKPRD